MRLGPGAVLIVAIVTGGCFRGPDDDVTGCERAFRPDGGPCFFDRDVTVLEGILYEGPIGTTTDTDTDTTGNEDTTGTSGDSGETGEELLELNRPVPQILAHDFDGDGLVDVLAIGIKGQASMLMGSPFGFTEERGYDIGPNIDVRDAALADINLDGFIDLLVRSYEGRVTIVALGDGMGGFGSPSAYTSPHQSASFAVGDLDGDGIVDVVTPFELDRTARIQLGTPEGGLTVGFSVGTSLQPSDIVIGDVNGDGFNDIVAVDGRHSDQVAVLLAQGDYAFGLTIVEGVPGVRQVFGGDLDKDGRFDLIGLGGAQVLYGAPDGMLVGPNKVRVGTFEHGFTLGDVNADGNIDLVSTGHYGSPGAEEACGGFDVAFGRGGRGFSDPVPLHGTFFPTDAVVADFNQDGIGDIATVGYHEGAMAVSLAIADPGCAPIEVPE